MRKQCGSPGEHPLLPLRARAIGELLDDPGPPRDSPGCRARSVSPAELTYHLREASSSARRWALSRPVDVSWARK